MVRIEDKFRLPSDQPFDYQLAMSRLRGFRAPRDKLGHLCHSGEVVRIKKGLYVPGWRSGERMPVDPLVLSGLVYGPSYVSLETALAHYGLILERVEEITCITTKRARVFTTPVGRFRYGPVSEHVFPDGVRLESASGGTYLLAEPEKALCDRIALIGDLRAARDIPKVLSEDLRIDPETVRQLRLSRVEEISRHYRRKSVSAFHSWLARETRDSHAK